jgi:hypothetical protein
MDVKRLNTGESEDDNPAHSRMIALEAAGRKDTYRTISAIAPSVGDR